MQDESHKKLRVLLVDDDEDEFILTRELLRDGSYRSQVDEPVEYDLEWVSTYSEGLQALLAAQHDVYLVDYRLGERDGLHLLREALSHGCRSPFILMTGQGSYDVDLEAMKAGATDYLVKSELSAPLLERTIRYAIERQRAAEEMQRHARQAELLARLTGAFAEASLSYPAVLETVARQTAQATGDACIIRLVSPDRKWLDPVACDHPQADLCAALQNSIETLPQPADSQLSGQVFTSGEPLLLPDVFEASRLGLQVPPHWAYLGDDYPVRSALIVPLQAEGVRIGTLGVLRFAERTPYTLEDLRFYEDLAGRAALAIENARLFEAEARRVNELRALQTATAALLNTIDLDALLAQILDIAQSAIPAAEQGALHLVTPGTGQLQVRATAGYLDPRIQQVDPRVTPNPAEAGLTRLAVQHVLQNRQPLLIRDVLSEPLLASNDRSAGGWFESVLRDGLPFRSAVVAPLVLDEDVLGVLTLAASTPAAFSEADRSLLVSFATTTTAALQNAMLHAEVQKLALTDSLTGLYNRRGFFELAQHEIERARRFNRPLSIILVDLDDFKAINDTYGHALGDDVLRQFAARLRLAVREVDILGRYGGDEFIILLPETDLATASSVGERVRLHLAEPLDLQGAVPLTGMAARDAAPLPVQVTASLGIASAGSIFHDLTDLLGRADTAAYQAKHGGRNRIAVSD